MLSFRVQNLAVVTLLLGTGTLAAADNFYETLPAFSGVQTSLALDGNLLSSPGNGTYDISLSGPSELTAAFAPAVSGGTLSLGFRPGSSFDVDGAANYTIRVPQGTLQAATVTGAGFFEGNGRAVSPSRFSVTTSGSGFTSFVEVPATQLSASSSGSGALVIEADDLQSVTLTATGSVRMFIGGLSGRATVSATGSSTVLISTASDSAFITGTVLGSSRIYYDGGRCSIIGIGSGTPCIRQQVQPPN